MVKYDLNDLSTDLSTEISPMELSRIASRLLRENGCSIFGRPKSDVKYEQTRFEARMKTGAYSRNSERGRK